MAIGCPRGLPFCRFGIHNFQTIQPPTIKMEHPEICVPVSARRQAVCCGRKQKILPVGG